MDVSAAHAGERNVFPAAIALYSVFRFLLELVRDDPVRNQLGPFSTSQWIALAILIAFLARRQ